MAIIAMFLLSLNGCGYKGDPYHEEIQENDANVEFIIKKSSEENNQSTKSR